MQLEGGRRGVWNMKSVEDEEVWKTKYVEDDVCEI